MGCCGCKDKRQGLVILDKKSGLWCVEFEEKYDKPLDLNVLVPFVCTKCGTIEWKCLGNSNY